MILAIIKVKWCVHNFVTPLSKILHTGLELAQLEKATFPWLLFDHKPYISEVGGAKIRAK